MLSQNPIKSDW